MTDQKCEQKTTLCFVRHSLQITFIITSKLLVYVEAIFIPNSSWFFFFRTNIGKGTKIELEVLEKE